MAASCNKRVMKRLMSDLEEMRKNPIPNISAEPLDENFLEWHCNFVHNDNVYHIILFFPDNYPYVSPSAEFMPKGYTFSGGAASPGKKGTKVCLSIFSDFADIHTEWKDEKSTGWSPSYTVQTVLMNLLAFIIEYSNDYCERNNAKLTKTFNCADCGHSFKKPHPPLPTGIEETKSEVTKMQITDYVSKTKINYETKPKTIEEMFGFGIVNTAPGRKPQLCSPCEHISGESFFAMKKSLGHVLSIMKEKLQFFLPLYINKNHSESLKKAFESSLTSFSSLFQEQSSRTKLMLDILSNLMNSTVVEFSKSKVASEHHLHGYFAFHRLLLWARDAYPNLKEKIERDIADFIRNPDNRKKSQCPNIGEWLIYLAGSDRYRWKDVNTYVIEECWKRNVMWYLKDHPKLGHPNAEKSYRLSTTFDATAVSQKLIAFQVIFLDVAMPSGMSIEDVKERYDKNNGFPTEDMVREMQARFKGLEDARSYEKWFTVLNMRSPTEDGIFNILRKSVAYAQETKGYYFDNNRNNRNQSGKYDRNKPYNRNNYDRRY